LYEDGETLSSSIFPEKYASQKGGGTCKTIWDHFQYTLGRNPDNEFLGTRNLQKEGEPYEWMTFKEANTVI